MVVRSSMVGTAALIRGPGRDATGGLRRGYASVRAQARRVQWPASVGSSRRSPRPAAAMVAPSRSSPTLTASSHSHLPGVKLGTEAEATLAAIRCGARCAGISSSGGMGRRTSAVDS
jgi:hypothetical protein